MVSSVARGADGEVYNVNADTAAAALAVALGAAKLMILTDVPGLYRTWPPEGDVLSEVGARELETMLPGLSTGMIPKMEACLTAVRGGVPQAHVLDGRQPHAVLLEIFTDSGTGTMVVPDAPGPAADHRRRTTGRDAGTQKGGTTVSATEVMQKRFAAALMPNYGLPQLALARGEGCRVWDADGREYLDLFAGIAVSSLGHAHPALVAAVTRQVSALAHTSNLFLHEPGIALAERILALLGPGAGPADARIFFANSGAEANEAAIKLVRRHWDRQGQSRARPVVVATENGFHGRTMGALALTGKASIRDPFGPFGIDVRFVPFGDADALRAAAGPDCAAVFVEPCQGEAGVIPPPPGYLRAAREACDASGALLVIDEIQSGIGRTGHWFAHQAEDVTPDVLTLAKGLGGGLPIGACVGFGPFGSVLGKGDHGSTFGANPVACAAALAVLETIEADGLLQTAATVGQQLGDGIAAVDHPMLAGVRGQGLWLAAILAGQTAAGVEAAARRAGFLVNAVQPDAIRLAPPLIITTGEAAAFLTALPHILDDAAAAGAAS